MKDEEYVFRQESRDRALVARSARNRRTHCGKGGRVKLPSDYMTKKELQNMNGEVAVYRLNEPMSWKEFKAMPDEHKETYIKIIRNKWNPPDSRIAEMFGISKFMMSNEMVRLGLNRGKASYSGWDEEGFLRWAHGVPAEAVEETVEEVEEVEEFVETPAPQIASCLPGRGELNFEGNVDEIANTIRVLLGGAKVRLSVCWNVLEEDDG